MGENKWVQIWLDLERREISENLALFSEEFEFRSVPDPARSELIRNLTNTEYLYFRQEFYTHEAVIGIKFYEETS